MDKSEDNNTNDLKTHVQSDGKILPTATVATLLYSPSTENELIFKQVRDSYCKATSLQLDHNSEFPASHCKLLMRRSTVDKATQIVVLASLRNYILRLAHHPSIAVQPGQSKLYDMLRRKMFWPHMANDLYETVAKCASCIKKGCKFKNTKPFPTFPAADVLHFVAMDILAPLPKTAK